MSKIVSSHFCYEVAKSAASFFLGLGLFCIYDYQRRLFPNSTTSSVFDFIPLLAPMLLLSDKNKVVSAVGLGVGLFKTAAYRACPYLRNSPE